jgi:prepilin-type N-terminal cleavage/methylation domain-containing protein
MTGFGFGKKNKASNKGFTLVELIVVLVLLLILLGLSIAGILTWQDWSRFKKENTGAETIFYAAQNQLSELSATGVYKEKVTKVVQNLTAYRLDSPAYPTKSYFNGTTIKYDEGDFDYYKWQPDNTSNGIAVWANTPDVDEEKKPDYQGSIYYLYAEAGSYSRYMKEADFETTDPAANLLFDLITPYISDKSVLNGAIVLEFSPEAMQVFSVCYSDRLDGFTYFGDAATDKIASVLDRSESVRREKQIGYFATDSMSIPLEGMGQTIQGNVELINRNTLDLVIRAEEIQTDVRQNVVMYKASGPTIDKGRPLMSFGFTPNNSLPASAQAAALSPTEVEVTFSEGVYAGQTKTLRIPIWKNEATDDGMKELILVLDAADVQAQSYLYNEAATPEASFLNTYSFYRYGFKYDEITRVGCEVTKASESAGVPSNTECPTFATITSESGTAIYTMDNGRHFYNVRYETDYKTTDDSRVFRLNKDIDWKEFTGQNGGKNWFLDSYAVGKNAGIMYQGLDHTINQSQALVRDTANYAFPGFRSLGVGDKFTGLPENAAADTKPYTISNLTITFAANMSYGVYGKEARTEWTAANITLFNSEYQSKTTYGGKHPSQVRAVKGEFPLGLFAENSGEISGLTLNAHRVIGMEKLNDVTSGKDAVVYTNMVGGFAGNNLGVMQNLTLRDVKDLDGEDGRNNNEAGVSFVNGKTDVGGILGRESWTLADADVVLSGLNNYAEVTGMANIGGIVGRAYKIRSFISNNNGDKTAFEGRKATYTDPYSIFGTFVAEGNNWIIDPGQSITGKDVSVAETILIEDCHNRGRVGGDKLIAAENNIIYLYDDGDILTDHNVCNNGAKGMYRCSNIGGIAGMTMDGYVTENSGNYGGKKLYQYFVANEQRKVTVNNCDSYRLYKETEWSDIQSAVSKTMANGKIKDSLEHDYYVGGLVGYAKLTTFTDCSNQPTNAEKATGNSFVFGRNYVGGLFGCDDGSVVTDSSSTRYNAQNYANVIGLMYVGGITGGYGIGDEAMDSLTFRNPIMNEGSMSVTIPGDSAVFDGYCNHGAVLAFRRDKLNYAEATNLYKQDQKIKAGVTAGGSRSVTAAPDSAVGGVVGNIANHFANLDNIQDDDTKKLVLRLVGFPTALVNNTSDIHVDEMIAVQDYSFYGGGSVGGIVGKIQNNVTGNKNKADYCVTDAIVWGFDATGGIWGATYTHEKNNYAITVNNTYLRNAIVFGRDMVGGIGGRASAHYNNDASKRNPDATSKYPFRVLGRYAVGGGFGYAGIASISNRTIHLEITTGEIEGKAFVGGYAGALSRYSTFSGKVENAKVTADYYAGGVFGVIYNAYQNDTSRIGLDKKITSDSVTVEAKQAFAGGYTGLYGTRIENNISDDYCLFYDVFKKVTNYSTNNANPLVLFVHNQLIKEENEDLYKMLNTVAKSHADNTGLNPNLGNVGDVTVSFDSTITPVTGGSVKARIFAGGLFGYICEGMHVVIDCANKPVTTKVVADAAVQSSKLKDNQFKYGEASIPAADFGERVFSYTGGIVGRIPNGTTISKAMYQGELNVKGSYIGQIAEVNDGKVTNCAILGYHGNSTKTTFTGGLVGLNGTRGTFGPGNSFAGAITLGDAERKVVGAFAGENYSNILSVENVQFTDANATQITANTAAGLLVGYNAPGAVINTYSSSVDYKLTSLKISNVPYAGVYAGINAGTITNGTVATQLGAGKKLTELTANSVSLNAELLTSGCTTVGLVAGKNVGTIQYIYANGENTPVKGTIQNGTYSNLGAIAGQNGDGTRKGTIINCFNSMNIGSENAAIVAGTAALIGGVSDISGCINVGNITAAKDAGGIAGVAVGVDADTSVTFSDCVNIGTLATTANDGKSAGIAVSTNDAGNFTLCRNYGTGAQYGITTANAKSMTKCLDNSGLNEGTEAAHTNPLAPNDEGLARNFYVWGTTDDVTVPDGEGDDSPMDVIYIAPNFKDAANQVSAEALEYISNYEWIYESVKQGIFYGKITGPYNMTNKDPELHYIVRSQFNGNPDDCYTYLKSLMTQFIYDHKDEIGLPSNFPNMPTMQDKAIEYAKDVIATGNISGTGDKIPYTALAVNKGAKALNDNYENVTLIWNKYAGIGANALYSNSDSEVNDPNLIYFYYQYFSNYNEYLLYMSQLYDRYVKEYGEPASEEAFMTYVKNIVATGKLPSDSKEDNSHWPVQLYYYGGADGTKGLYFKRKYYHFAGIASADLNPTDNNTSARDRFNAVDAQFKAMAEDTTTYPDSSAGEFTAPVGFVKQ